MFISNWRKLWIGFPRTPSNVEILILKKIFSFEEAWLGSQLSGAMESIQDIARRVGLSSEETQIRLSNMAKRGLLWNYTQKGKTHFRLAPFIVGIYEAQLESMDHELAHLFEQYMLDGGAVGIMKPQPRHFISKIVFVECNRITSVANATFP